MEKQFDEDKEGRTCFHILGYRGNVETLTLLLNYDRECLKKYMSDLLNMSMKKEFGLKPADICKGELVTTTFHSDQTRRKHAEFN